MDDLVSANVVKVPSDNNDYVTDEEVVNNDNTKEAQFAEV